MTKETIKKAKDKKEKDEKKVTKVSKKEEEIKKEPKTKAKKEAKLKKTSEPKKETKAKAKKDASSKKSLETKKDSKTKVKEKATTKKEKKVAKVSKKAKEVTSSEEENVVNQNDITPKKTSTRKKASTKSTVKPMLSEYYDLPYRYNQTVVKILAQTPTTLFVYWDISDEDRDSLISKYGDNVFYETKPILIVHNTTKNYAFELEINDFANSWYIRTQEPDCEYMIELGRRVIKHPETYIYIDSSNNITSPNNHILFEKVDLGHVMFRNIKTNTLSSKDFGSLRFINDMDKLYGNIYDVYSRLYKEETLEKYTMPSSGEFIKR